MRSPLLTFASALSVALLMPWSVAQESKAPGGTPATAATSNASTGTTNAKNAPTAKSGARPSLTVTLVEAQARDVPISLAANGSVAAWQEAILGAEVNGLRLAEVRAQIGDVVKRGQVLAVFAAETVEAELAQARAQVVEAEAAQAEARANAERSQSIAGTGALSAQQVAQYATAEKTAQARLELARAQLAVQQLRLNHTKVVASDDGIISARNATVGAVVPAGQELFRLIRKGRLEWRGEVTAIELGKLRKGLPVSISATGVGTVEGKLRMVGPTVDAVSRNALVYVDLPNGTKAEAKSGTKASATASSGQSTKPGSKKEKKQRASKGADQNNQKEALAGAAHGFKPGMFARGEFALGSSSAFTVPQATVVVRDGFSYVFRAVPGSDGTAKVARVKVETGRRVEDRIEILRGLNPADRIVATGVAFLTDGDTVKVVK